VIDVAGFAERKQFTGAAELWFAVRDNSFE
jgi:hypothetical protein